MRTSWVIALVAMASLLGAGCGGSSSGDDANSPDHYLLTPDEVSSQAEASSDPAPAKAVLDFWRAVQFQDFPTAYNDLSAPLRQRIPYDRFLTKMGSARGLFLAKPKIYSISRGDGFVTVDVAALQGDVVTPADQIIGISATPEAGTYRISSDIFNLFHESAQPPAPLSDPHHQDSIPPDEPLDRLAGRGAVQLVIRQGLISLLSLGGVLALTGLLDPAEFALYGYASAVALIAPAVGDLGLGANLIRSTSLLDRHVRGSTALLLVFWVPVCGLGFLLGAALDVYGFTTATVALLFSALLLLCLQTLPTAILERGLRFGSIAGVEVVQRLVFMTVAVALAIANPQQWSIPLGLFCGAVVGLPAMMVAARWRWRPELHRGEPLFRGFSSQWWQARVASQLAYASYPLLGGILFTAHEVGLIVWALAVTSIPGLLAPAVARVVFPATARSDESRQVAVFRPLFRGLLFVGLPGVAALFACAEPLTAYVLGTKWLQGVPLLRLESVTTMAGLALTPAVPLLFLAIRPTRVKWMIVSMAAGVVLLALVLAPWLSFRAISVAAICSGFAVLAVAEMELRRSRSYSLLRDALPGLAGVAVAVAVGLPLAGLPHDAASAVGLGVLVAAIQAGVSFALGGAVDPRQLLRARAAESTSPEVPDLLPPAGP